MAYSIEKAASDGRLLQIGVVKAIFARMGRYLVGVGIVAVAAVSVSGCNNRAEPAKTACFSIVQSAAGMQPYSPILIDSCAGRTWLLVRMDTSRKDNKSFTYRWQVLDRDDFMPPSLVTR